MALLPRSPLALKVLLKTAAQAVRKLVGELYPGVRVGMIHTLHPAGRDAGFKPHIRLVMTKGGLKDGEWVEIDELLGDRLAAKWRYLLCKHLQESRPFDQKLRKVIDQGYAARFVPKPPGTAPAGLVS